MLANILLAACFPDDIGSPQGLVFVRWTSVALAVCVTFASVSNYFHRQEPNVNESCRTLHRILACGNILNWGAVSMRTLRSTLTWRTIRWTYAKDGCLFIAITALYHHCGPPTVYHPGNVSFMAAMMRGAVTLVASFLLTPSIRGGIARCANWAGLNHVRIELSELGLQGEAHPFHA